MSESSEPRDCPGSSFRRGQPWWGWLLLAVPVVTAVLLSWHSLGDLDIWFHQRAGQDLLDGQGLTQVNRYSFTEPDHSWINHEWMFQVLAALTGPGKPPPGDLLDVSGWNLLRTALTLLILLGIMAGDDLWARLRGRHGMASAVWLSIPLLAGFLLMWPRLTLRPELFSYLFFVGVLRNIERIFTGNPVAFPGWRALVDPRLPTGRLLLLTVLWAQFHGFAILAPLLVLLAWILSPFQARLAGTRANSSSTALTGPQAAGLGVLAAVALILTPNGPAGLLMPIRAIAQFQTAQVDLRTTVSELVPLQETPNALGLTINLYRAGLVGGLVWVAATWGRVSLLRILVFALAGAAAWLNQRSIGFFGLAFILLFSGPGPCPWRFALDRQLRRLPRSVMTVCGLVGLTLAAGIIWIGLIGDEFYLREGVARRFGGGTTPARFSTSVATVMSSAGPRPYFANLDAAAFLLANAPGPIFIDGRTEAYSADMWMEYRRIKQGDARSLEILASRRVEAVALATGGNSFAPLAEALLQADSWVLTAADGAGLLFEPSNRSTDSSNLEQRLLESAADLTLTYSGGGSSARRADFCLAAGRLHRFSGNEMGLEQAYRQGLAYRPDHPTLNHNLGNLLLERKEFRAALTHFQAALKTNGRLAGSALNAGVCLMRLGLHEEAAESFGKAAAIDPGGVAAWVNLASARFATGDRPGAIKALEKALELRPRDRNLRQRLQGWKRGTG